MPPEPGPGDERDQGPDESARQYDLSHSQGAVLGDHNAITQNFFGRRRRPPGQRPRSGLLVTVATVATLVLVTSAAVVVALLARSGGSPPARDDGPPPSVRQLPMSLQNGRGIAVAGDGTRAYVSDATAKKVFVVDLTAGGIVVGDVQAGDSPGPLALSDDGTTLAVSDQGLGRGTTGGLVLVDVRSGTSSPRIDLPGGRPDPIAMTGDGRTVFIGDNGRGDEPGRAVYRVDVGSGKVERIPVLDRPSGIALARDDGTVHITCPGSGQDPRRALITMPTDGGPATVTPTDKPLFGVTTTPDGTVFAAAYASEQVAVNAVEVFDARGRPLGARAGGAVGLPWRMAASLDGRRLAVMQHTDKDPAGVSDRLAVIETDTGRRLLDEPVGGTAREVAFTPDGRVLVVTSRGIVEVTVPG